MSRKATITANWKEYGLSTSLEVEAPDLRTTFSIYIDGLIEDTLDGGSPFIPSSSLTALYRIVLTDNLGTTDEEWYEKYLAGQLSFAKQSSQISIVTSGGLFYIQQSALGTSTINERYISATINDDLGDTMTAYTYYMAAPFGGSIVIRNYEVNHSSSAITLANSGVFYNVEMRISGTRSSYITEEEFFKLVYLGIFTLVYNTSSSSISSTMITLDTTTRHILLYVDADSSAVSSGYLHAGWNGDDLTVTSINPRNWYPASSSYTTLCLVMLFSTAFQMTSSSSFTYEPGSNMYIDITSTWNSGSSSDASQNNTYGKHVYAEDIKNLYDTRPSRFSSGYYPYLALGIHDQRISAKHLHEYIDNDYKSGNTYSRLLNCGCYIRSSRFTNIDGDKFLFTPSMYNRTNGWWDSGTGYIDDDENEVQILLVGTQFRYIYSETSSCGYSQTLMSNMPLYDNLSLSFRHSANVESGTGTVYHTSNYVYLDFRDNETGTAGNIYWSTSYVYGYDRDYPAGFSYGLVDYQMNTTM